MGRQLFLHHYLPAHLASCLVTGALVEFVFNVEPVDPAEIFGSDGKPHAKNANPSRGRPIRERIGSSRLLGAWLATLVILAVTIFGFVFFAPLTYGTPGLNVEQVKARKWLSYDFHFAK